VTRDGAFDAAVPTLLSSADLNHRAPKIVFDGSRYLVSYEVPRESTTGYQMEARGRYVAQSRTPTTDPEFELLQAPVSNLEFAPSCNGECFLAVSSTVMGGRASILSTKYEPSRSPVANSSLTALSVQPEDEGFRHLDCTQTGCVAIYTRRVLDLEGSHLYLMAAGLDLAGQLRPNATWTITEIEDEYSFATAFATDGSRYLVVWWDGADRALNSLPLDALGAPFPTGKRVLAEALDVWYQMRLAHLGQSYLLVLSVDRAYAGGLRGMRLDSMGNLLTFDSLGIASGASTNVYATHLVPATDQFFLGYVKDSTPFVARLDREGKLIPNSAAGSTASSYDLASDGHDLLVAWCDASNQSADKSTCVPHATLYKADGTRRVLPDPIGPACGAGSLVWSGNAFVWAWTDRGSWDFEPYEQHFTELEWSPAGKLTSRDTAVERDQSGTGFGTFTMNGAGLLWTYSSIVGDPEARFVSALRIHRRQITGLCWGDPLGDRDGNGVCDSREPEPPRGAGGMGGTAGASGANSAGGTSGAAAASTPSGGSELSHSASGGAIARGGAMSSSFGTSGRSGIGAGGRESSTHAAGFAPIGNVGGAAAPSGESGVDVAGSSSTQLESPNAAADPSALPRGLVRLGDGELSGSGCSCRLGSGRSSPWRGSAMALLAVGMLFRLRRSGPRRDGSGRRSGSAHR
jgi:MYXO-CTERM domain-containing protein